MSAPQADTMAAEVVGALPAGTDPFALSLNESPFAPLPSVRAALIASAGVVNRYPEYLPTRLRDLIARRIGVPDEQVVPGAGATGVVLAALQATTEPGDRIVLSSPTFDGYPIFAQMTGLVPVAVPLDEDGHHDLAAMADAASDAKVVVLCRPHNPTGTLESEADVERFLKQLAPETVVLLDEAYIEFVAPEHRLDVPALVRRFPNLLVLRTFSKAYGLAGLRIGYGFSSPELAKMLWAMLPPFGIGVTSAVAVAASYDADTELRQRIRSINEERRFMRLWLREMGVRTTDSHANFVYLPPAGPLWHEVFDDAGLRARHYADGAVRVTVGSNLSTRAVLCAIAKAAENVRYAV